MIFPEVKIYQPDCFEDFRGELFTLFKKDIKDYVKIIPLKIWYQSTRFIII